MKTKWWWNEGFDGLMEEVSAWAAEQPNIQVVHSDWKYAQPTGKNQGYWYFVMLYKE
jgi:hypothetical protein